jgi:hypothetical protein
MNNNLILVLHLGACGFLTGLIWLIQLVHYPSFKYIDPTKFTDYQRFHTLTITFIVGPVMVFEIFSGLYLLIQNQFQGLFLINFLGLLLIWLATAFFSVPAHGILAKEMNMSSIQFLVNTNWVRTILWSLRSGLLVYIILKYMNYEPTI